MDALNNEKLTAAITRMRKEDNRVTREVVLDLLITEGQFLAPVLLPQNLPHASISQTIHVKSANFTCIVAQLYVYSWPTSLQNFFNPICSLQKHHVPAR